jgi:hypothetical protein
LDQLSFLAGVTAVDDLVGSGDEGLDDMELAAYAFVVDDLDAELRR